ncbi:MAG: metal-dependent hydrolase [Betaproteobacteria bacterium]|nr:metal-dependent hydrolase [Betaproteobacteria bacterium]
MKTIFRSIATTAALLVAATALAQAPKKAELLWFGQSAFRLTTPGGKVIMIDPWLTTNPGTPEKWKNLDELGKVDLILVTHAHGDHFGDSPAIAKKHNARIWSNGGLGSTIATLGIVPGELAPRMNTGGTITPFDGVRITMVHAEHSSELVWKNPDTGKSQVYPGGEPVGFIIELENGLKIYHMGDTGLFGDMKFIGEYYKPDVVLIPIGGHYVLDPKDAAFAVNNWLKPRHAVPMHYGTNIFLKGTPEEFIAALGKTSTKVHHIHPGDKLEF